MTTFARAPTGKRSPRAKKPKGYKPYPTGLTGQSPQQLQTGQTPNAAGMVPGWDTWHGNNNAGLQGLADNYAKANPGWKPPEGSGIAVTSPQMTAAVTGAATPQTGEPAAPTAPQLPSSAAAISNAEGAFGLNVNDFNHQLLEAAYRYGGADSIDQYIYNPVTGHFDINKATISPGDQNLGEVADIRRTADQAGKSSEATRLRGGTLRSGLRLQDLTDIGNTKDRQLADARHRYEDAVTKIRGLIDKSLADYIGTKRTAGAADLEAFDNSPPEDLAPEEIAPGTTTPLSQVASEAPVAKGGKRQPAGKQTKKRAPRKKKGKK